MKLGIGCDIVELKRIEKAMEKTGFLKILTPKEREQFELYQGKRQIEWLAGRFAAKEAIIKALHEKYSCTLSDIEILSAADGAPYCTFPSCEIQISIAHEKTYAIAYAVAQF